MFGSRQLWFSSHNPSSGCMTLVKGGTRQHVVYNNQARTASIAALPSQTFNVKSLLAAGVWNNNLRLSILGYRSSYIVYTSNVILQATATSVIDLHWTNIERLNFTSYGGTSAGFPHYSGTMFAMDDLCISKQQEEIDIE
ncbi:unnamed protein product [Rotaria sp. Silwood2]|nr:unnamed protein product [Rotaria sp. Silwood2]CAF3249445.1 unnamed protein product [Rotaria sp. Silwood2]CAF4171189.1 unnamed protein product [Rotaria sp. Silwood2]CAF4239666.1 unnamed protein product [Rotaria sp. Silwood2]